MGYHPLCKIVKVIIITINFFFFFFFFFFLLLLSTYTKHCISKRHMTYEQVNAVPTNDVIVFIIYVLCFDWLIDPCGTCRITPTDNNYFAANTVVLMHSPSVFWFKNRRVCFQGVFSKKNLKISLTCKQWKLINLFITDIMILLISLSQTK